ncbi:NAD(P)-binding protein [Ideonella sp. DXS22W]|uniref:NAD(P)-binding protein n=1 Tax=Pseudaquabacterium inlustre TaxID=2984192 RepID=A0ABU9CHV8_9BURK
MSSTAVAHEITTDYLVIGAGTVGMAFADTLLAERPDAHITIVDRHGQPGGHWNDAYPFVTLHQPSSFYGVNSLPLGSGQVDAVGLNQGLLELASGAEINAYFDRVMHQRLLPSGRVRYLPLSEVGADGVVQSLLSGERTRVQVQRKTVDATAMSPEVPATHTPRFAVAPGVRLVPPNALPGLWQAPPAGQARPRQFVVLGAGKTAMDACIWLLQSGASPEQIQWVVPRDSWLINRLHTQNTPAFFHQAIGGQADQLAAQAAATSLDDLYLRLEACGALLRIDPTRMPQMFHLATVSLAELAELRRIHQVIRLGHVQALDAEAMVLDQGRVPVAPGTLFIDCTASAVRVKPLQPVFQPGRIVPQLVRVPFVAFSAALIAWVEAHLGDDDTACNRLCTPVPFTHTPAAYPRMLLMNLMNQGLWAQDKALREWARRSRLDGFGHLTVGIDPQDGEKLAQLARLRDTTPLAVANLKKLVALAEGAPARG